MRYAGMQNYEEQNKRYRDSKGCVTPFGSATFFIGDIGFKKCIGNYFDYSAVNLMEAERAYEKGVMPFPGTLMDQPNKIIDIFRVISSHKTDRQIELQREQARKTKASSGRR